MDFDTERIEYFITELSYWAQGRPREVIETAIQHSDCMGIYHQGTQVAFARLVTDRVGIRRTLLATRDAHGLYQAYGRFHPLDIPTKWMSRERPDSD